MLDALRPGYRSLPLRSRLGTRIDLCNVLMRISIDDVAHPLLAAEQGASARERNTRREVLQARERGSVSEQPCEAQGDAAEATGLFSRIKRRLSASAPSSERRLSTPQAALEA